MRTRTNLKSIRNKSIFSVNTILKIMTLFIITIVTISCDSDEPEPTNTEPDGVALEQRFKDNRANAKQTFTMDAVNGGTITGTQGTKVTFPANAFGLNGSPVTGNVDVELIEIYDRASMLLNNMPTSGIKPTGEEAALKSAGEFFINAKQNGSDLDLLLMAEVSSKGVGQGFPETMNIFRAGDNETDLDLWQEADEDGDNITDVGGMGERENPDAPNGWEFFYLFDISDFGWTNLDRWFNYTGALTQIYIDVPDIFNGTNCEVYLIYDGEPTALARMDIYDAQTGMFTEHYGQIPVGQEIHVILVAEINGVLHSTIQGTTVVDGHIEVMTSPQPTTQAALNTAINALP